MTPDQVLVDTPAAPDASESKTKPVRRRTTKKTDTAVASAPAVEQPALPEMPSEDAPAPAAVEKPKRTRTRVVKAKVTPNAPETADSTQSDSSNTAPVVEAAPSRSETQNKETAPSVEAQTTTPTSTSNEDVRPEGDGATSSRPSVPARFPSRFKRAPQPETASQMQSETASTESAPLVQSELPAQPLAEPTLVPVSEVAIETREDMEMRAPESAAPVAPSQDENRGNESESPQNADGSAPQNGDFNGQNGDGTEGGGRMRYRERREFRRQQRMQQRQDRLGPNGEVLPPLPQDGRAQDGRNQEGRPQDGRNGQNGFGRGQNGFTPVPPYERQQQPRRREYDFFALKGMGDEDLENAAREYGLEPDDSRGRDALVMALMEAQARAQNSVLKTGILDAHDHNKAFLRCEGYTPSEQDVYVSQTQIKRFNLKTGDMVFGTARAPKENERFFGLLRVESINGLAPEEMRYRKDFEKLTPIFPTERYSLETEQTNITARIIDLVTPVGKGQRGLIVAPPKAGKTTLIKSIANSIAVNNPEAELFVLLIDERPEEVTDISRSVRGTVVASTFDEMPDNHMRVADIVMERAKRLVEMKQDVVILLDSITRLSRASNLVVAPSGRTLSGGLDPAAMYRPKRMFGAARNIEEGGSLTILATALVDTGSRMDEMIFEEFKGTGNMDLVLDRDLFNQRIFPALDINKSGTRRDDLLLSKEELGAVFHLRQTLARLDNDQAVKLLIDRLKNTKSNANFMEVVAKSARQAEIKNA